MSSPHEGYQLMQTCLHVHFLLRVFQHEPVLSVESRGVEDSPEQRLRPSRQDAAHLVQLRKVEQGGLDCTVQPGEAEGVAQAQLTVGDVGRGREEVEAKEVFRQRELCTGKKSRYKNCYYR